MLTLCSPSTCHFVLPGKLTVVWPGHSLRDEGLHSNLSSWTWQLWGTGLCASVSSYLKDVDSVIWFLYESRHIISSLPSPVPLSAALSASHFLPLITLVTYLVPAWYPQMLGSPSLVVLSGDHHSISPKGNMWEKRTSWFQDHQHRKQADTLKKNVVLPFVTPMQYV